MEENTEQFNYNFFECDGTKGREILGKYLKIINEKNNNEELKLLLKRKKKLYESLGYVKVKIGINSFGGYIGFKLEIGYVVLNKLYDDMKEYKIAENNAIYILLKKTLKK